MNISCIDNIFIWKCLGHLAAPLGVCWGFPVSPHGWEPVPFKRLRSGKSEEEWSFTVFFKTAVRRGSQSCAQHDFLHITRGVTIQTLMMHMNPSWNMDSSDDFVFKGGPLFYDLRNRYSPKQ